MFAPCSTSHIFFKAFLEIRQKVGIFSSSARKLLWRAIFLVSNCGSTFRYTKVVRPNCNDLLRILLASKKLALGTRGTGARRRMLLSAHGVSYFQLCPAWAHGARRSAYGVWSTIVNVGFSTRNQKHFLSTYSWSNLRANKNWQNITFVRLCYLDLRISTVLHVLSFRREKFSTKILKFCWGILLAQICPAHGARECCFLAHWS